MGNGIRRRSAIKGRDRKGIRAKDYEAQVSDPDSHLFDDPVEHDRPRVMIETMRLVDAEDGLQMTARDWAIYELLMSHARRNGISQEWHTVDARVISGFLREEHKLARIKDAARRIGHTFVRYDFRQGSHRSRRGDMPLLMAEIREDLMAATACVRFSVPEPVREAILGASDYAMLQLELFASFTCRYTARLYQRLTWMSGRPKGEERRWAVAPEKLARMLLYPVPADGSFHVGSFMKRAVEPALADLQSEFVRNEMAFRVQILDPERGEGRGRPIQKLVFEVTPRSRLLNTRKAARLSTVEINVVRENDPVLEWNELPGQLLVGRAMTQTGMDGVMLSRGWRAAVESAKADPNADVLPGMQGGALLFVLKRSGVAAAFSMWVGLVSDMDAEPTQRRSVPPSPRVPAPAGRMADAAEGKPATVFLAEPAPQTDVAASQPKAEEPPVLGPKARRARRKELTIMGAVALLDALDGKILGTPLRHTVEEHHLLPWIDTDCRPWDTLKLLEEPCWPTVNAALQALARTDHETRKGSLTNLALALRDWDMARLRKVAGAILGSAKSGCMPVVRQSRVGRPVPPRGFIATRPLTEADAERDFLDPAYAAGAVAWDDRCAADLEPADDCPF